MERKKPQEENEILKALQLIHYENEKLQNCLQEIVITRKSLEAKWDSVENHLTTLIEEGHDLQSLNLINRMKIETVEKETSQFEENLRFLTESLKNVNIKIKEHKENFDNQIGNFIVAADKLSVHFLITISNSKIEEEECLQALDDLHIINEKFIEKENDILRIKKELGEFVFHGIPENNIELIMQDEERKLVLNFMEDELLNARKQLEDLFVIETEKKMKEYELHKYS